MRDPKIIWGEDGAPRSEIGDDIYFSPEDGRAETRHVFLAGNGLPARWRGRAEFAIGELGFGLGLNFFETLAAWRADPAAPARLDYLSVDWAPPATADIARLGETWPSFRADADRLLEAWPPAPGWATRRWDDAGRALTLRLGIGDAEALLERPSSADVGLRDAWFLDGFSPAKNPELWSEAVLGAAWRWTRPGGTAATYAAAGHVRRRLSGLGFEVERAPGFGRKREMLRATKPNAAPAGA